MKKHNLTYTLSLAGLLLLASEAAAQRYDSYDSYDEPRGRYDYGSRDDYRDREQYRLEKERDRIEDERRRLEEERAAAKAVPQKEQCPQGFHPGNHRCTDAERKRGCKDMRMPGGTTCNAGPFS